MNIRISPLAAARLRALLAAEETEEALLVRVVPLTSGCSTPSFALELTEARPGFRIVEAEGVPFTCPEEETDWLDGLVIELDRTSGKFSLLHPDPPFLSDCHLPQR
ncbi:iron-sulfur cluster biosynthesis family protein [Salinithrix halophila]|uniref:Iron-sulfur cluster biosynthesis family protein n=1 Tax=Salinithrix halophila TaxID=1485204 RepID=A0ABV8JHS1_9BACL